MLGEGLKEAKIIVVVVVKNEYRVNWFHFSIDKS